MSSKAKHPGPEEHGPQATKNLEQLHDDDAIVVPKGTSKLKFLFLLGLTIFILIIFTVGQELQSSIGRQPANTDIVSWDGPVIGKKTMTAADFTDQKRREDDYRRLMQFQDSGFDDDAFASELLIDELAKKSGIEVPTKELVKAVFEGSPGICRAFQNKAIYDLYLKNSGISPLVFEGVLRRKLRFSRYVDLVEGATPAPETSAIEAEWKRLHPQTAFDVIEAEHAKFDAEAKAAQPDAAGMKEWYDALADKRPMFFTDFLPETNAAELIAFRFSGENTAAGLLEKFPLPADKDKEQVAKDYYNQYSSVRYVRATPLPEGSPEAEGKNRLINSFEEVADMARKESLVLAAFRAWVGDVKARKLAGETINLESEATSLGLTYRAADGGKSEAEWTALADIGGPYMSRSIVGTQKDDFAADVTVDLAAMTFARVVEKNAAAAPPFEKVAEKAGVEWLKQKTQELAMAKLNLVRDSFPKPEENAPSKNPKADEAAFKAAAEAQGLSVERRDWMSFSEQNSDPESAKPSHEFLRFNGFLRNLTADELAAVQVDRTRTHSYLVRALGEREPPVVKLAPGDLASILKTLKKKSIEEFFQANFSPKALAERYKLRVRGSKDIPEPGT